MNGINPVSNTGIQLPDIEWRIMMSNDLQTDLKELDRLYESGTGEEIEDFIQRKLREYVPCCGGFRLEHVTFVNEAGAFYRGRSQLQKAEYYFKYAVDMIGTYVGRNNEEYATALNNLAGTYRLMGSYAEAIKLFREVLTLYAEIAGQDTYLYASALNNIALVYMDTNDLNEAVSCQEKALEIVADMEDYRLEYAVSLGNLAGAYQGLGLYEKACELVRESADILREEAGEDSYVYAAGLNNLASCNYFQKDYEKAKEYYRMAADILKRHFGEYQKDYAVTMEGLSRVSEKMGNREEAFRYQKRAYEIYDKILGKDNAKTVASKKKLDGLKQ